MYYAPVARARWHRVSCKQRVTRGIFVARGMVMLRCVQKLFLFRWNINLPAQNIFLSPKTLENVFLFETFRIFYSKYLLDQIIYFHFGFERIIFSLFGGRGILIIKILFWQGLVLSVRCCATQSEKADGELWFWLHSLEGIALVPERT